MAIRKFYGFSRERIRRKLVKAQILRDGFLFVDIPRTGSTTLRVLLSSSFPTYCKGHYSQTNDPISAAKGFIRIPEHIPARVSKSQFTNEEWNSLWKFSISRNPFHRIASMYKYRQSREGVQTGTFDEFVSSLRHPQYHSPSSAHFHQHWRETQWSFLASESNELLADDVFRFEDLESAYMQISERIGVSLSTATRLQHSPDSLCKIDFMDSQTTQIIQEYYRDDFEYFGYDLDPPKVSD